MNNQSHSNKGNKNSTKIKILFYLFVIGLPLILLFPSLKKDWALLDDPDMVTQGLKAIDGILEKGDFSGFYPAANRASGRFHPCYYLYLGLRAKILGLNPFVNHLFVFALLYIHLLLIHSFVHYFTHRYLYSVFGICLYLFFAQGEWSTAYYNWYSLILTEPILPIYLICSLLLFFKASNLIEKKPHQAWMMLAFSIALVVLSFFTKEPSFIFTGTAFVIFILTLKPSFNSLHWSKKAALVYCLGCLFAALVFIILYYLIKPTHDSAAYPRDYRLAPGHIFHQAAVLWFKLFQSYTILILILPFAFFVRMLCCYKEKARPEAQDAIQVVFLSWMVFSCAVLLPWSQILGRHLLIPVLCFSIFGALELYGIVRFFRAEPKKRILDSPRGLIWQFWIFVTVLILFFVFGKLIFSIKIYINIMKIIVVAFSVFLFARILRTMVTRGGMDRLLLHLFSFMFLAGFLLFLFMGSIGAYNFNHKYDGIEGVLVRMVKVIARDAVPNARLYFHLPQKHTYIGQMNYRMSLFEKRPDLNAFVFKVDPQTEYKRGDIIIHHPWLSPEPEFPFFKFNGRFEKPEIVKIEHPFIKGASYSDLKKWLFANLTFPRDPKTKFLEKKIHKNQWEIFLILSKTLTITTQK